MIDRCDCEKKGIEMQTESKSKGNPLFYTNQCIELFAYSSCFHVCVYSITTILAIDANMQIILQIIRHNNHILYDCIMSYIMCHI